MTQKWRITTNCLLVMVLAFSFALTGYADPGKGSQVNKPSHVANKQFKKNKNYKHDRGGSLDATDIIIAAGITYLEARRFAEGAHATGYKALPPGIQKNLMRGKPLPPGIAKKMVPSAMLGKLPVHPGYRWGIAGRDLILIHVATEAVADILHDVFK